MERCGILGSMYSPLRCSAGSLQPQYQEALVGNFAHELDYPTFSLAVDRFVADLAFYASLSPT